MRISENRKLAWGVLALSVVVSIVLMGGSCIVRERRQVMNLFGVGIDATQSVRHSMDAYLDGSAQAAQIMASEADIYGVDAIYTDMVRNLAGQIGDGDDLNARYDAYTELKTGVEQLYNKMYNLAVGDNFTNFKMAYDDFWGYEDMIGRDEYRARARSYNALTDGFPGKIVASIMGQDDLNTFGG